jgi:hypothetical protein
VITALSTPASPTWTILAPDASGPAVGDYDALACVSGSLCIGACPTNTGGGGCLGATYATGSVTAWDPSGWASAPGDPLFIEVAPTEITSLWCKAATCFAADAAGDLYTAPSVTSTGGRWASTFHDHARITSGQCPTRTLCFAVDAAGRVLLGQRTPRRARDFRAGPPSPGA